MPTGPIIKEGFPLIGVMLFITIIAAYFGYYSIAIITFILALFFVNFFRNPKRNIPTDPDAILSPADGKVMEIEDVYEDLYLHRECKKVTIFLSVLMYMQTALLLKVKLHIVIIRWGVFYLLLKKMWGLKMNVTQFV